MSYKFTLEYTLNMSEEEINKTLDAFEIALTDSVDSVESGIRYSSSSLTLDEYKKLSLAEKILFAMKDELELFWDIDSDCIKFLEKPNINDMKLVNMQESYWKYV